MSEQLTIHPHDLWRQIKQQLQMPRLIKQAIHQKIMTIVAQEQGIEVAVSELQASADQLRIQHQLLTAEATIAWLEKHQLSVEDLEDIAQSHVVIEKLKTTIIEPQIEPYFYRHQLDYAEAIYYEIVVAQRELAMELFYALQEREIDFLAVLHRYVNDRTTRIEGSYRHVVQRRDLSAELSAVIFAAQAPQVLRPFPIGTEMRLIYVVELLPRFWMRRCGNSFAISCSMIGWRKGDRTMTFSSIGRPTRAMNHKLPKSTPLNRSITRTKQRDNQSQRSIWPGSIAKGTGHGLYW